MKNPIPFVLLLYRSIIGTIARLPLRYALGSSTYFQLPTRVRMLRYEKNDLLLTCRVMLLHSFGRINDSNLEFCDLQLR